MSLWKYSSFNSYPHIILHDCIIEHIDFNDKQLVLTFDDSGFWLSHTNEYNPFDKILRTGKSTLSFSNVDLFFLQIRLHREFRFLRNTIFTKVKQIPFQNFMAKINGKKWRFEIVDELYAVNSAMFCGYVYFDKKPYFDYMQIEIPYGEMNYCWNEIQEDRTW